MDLKWQVAMISMRLKKFYKKTGRKLQFDAKEPVGFHKTKVECFNCHKTGHFAREYRLKGNQDIRRRDVGNTRYKAKDNGRRLETGRVLKALMSVKEKIGLGFSEQVKENELYDEALMSVFDSHLADIEGRSLCVQFTYGPKQSKTSKSDAKTSDSDSCKSNSSVETLESVPEPVVIKPKVVSQPEIWSDAPIIEEYESESDNEYVIKSSKEQETPSLGYELTKEACFVCGSFSHLIRDYDFHEKRMTKQAELNKRMCKGTGQRENRLVWNNMQRVNHQNQFVPTAVLTRTGRIPVNTARASSTKNVNTARHNFNSKATPTNAAKKVNTVKLIVNNDRPKTAFHKNQLPIRRSFYRTTAPRTNFSNQKVNTAEVKAVSAVGEKGKLLLSPQQVVIGESKDITGIKFPNTMDDPHKAKGLLIVDVPGT
ncbi:ribonuclease H-like domain-containing protein [Tanacetum coccineum]